MATPRVISFNNGNLTQNNSLGTLSTQLSLTFDDQSAADTLSYSYTSLNTLGMLTAIASNNSGTGNIGFVTYNYSVPNAAVQYLAAGQTLSETFRVKATSTSTNLITNGDFSAPIASSSDVPGWTVTNGQAATGPSAQSAFVSTINGNPLLSFAAVERAEEASAKIFTALPARNTA